MYDNIYGDQIVSRRFAGESGSIISQFNSLSVFTRVASIDANLMAKKRALT